MNSQSDPSQIPAVSNNGISLLSKGIGSGSASSVKHDSFQLGTSPSASIETPGCTFPIVVRLSRHERNIISKLSVDYAKSGVSILGKSLRLYTAILDAAMDGGTLIMRSPYIDLSREGESSNSPNSNTLIRDELMLGHGTTQTFQNQKLSNQEISHSEAIIAVRDQFADYGKCPISLNRTHIAAGKGPKTERISLRVNSSFNKWLKDLEFKTGLNKSEILRDSLQLYDFVKRQFEKGGVAFFIGNALIEGI